MEEIWAVCSLIGGLRSHWGVKNSPRSASALRVQQRAHQVDLLSTSPYRPNEKMSPRCCVNEWCNSIWTPSLPFMSGSAQWTHLQLPSPRSLCLICLSLLAWLSSASFCVDFAGSHSLDVNGLFTASDAAPILWPPSSMQLSTRMSPRGNYNRKKLT